jgi:hypothetical protein
MKIEYINEQLEYTNTKRVRKGVKEEDTDKEPHYLSVV